MTTFRPPMLLRVWHLIVGGVLCSTFLLAPVGLWLWLNAALKKVAISPDSVSRSPFGGAATKDQIARWGRHVYTPDPSDRSISAKQWTYIVVQRTNGGQFSICLEDFSEGERIEALMREYFGGSSGGLKYRWFLGPRFTDAP